MGKLTSAQRFALALAALCWALAGMVWLRGISRSPTQPDASAAGPREAEETAVAPVQTRDQPDPPAPAIASPKTEGLKRAIADFTARTERLLRAPAGEEPELQVLRAIHSLEGMERGAEREHSIRVLIRAIERDPSALERLCAIAGGPESFALRRLAIIVLGRTKLERATNALWELTDTAQPEEARIEAIWSLAQGGMDPNAHWPDEQLNRLDLVRAASRRMFGADTAKGFLNLLEGERDRRVAALLVGLLGQALPEPRMGGMRSKDERLKDLPICERVMRVAADHPEHDVRLAAVSALQDTKNQEGIEFLAGVAERDSSPAIRATAIRSLYGVAEGEVVQNAMRNIVLTDADPDILQAAVGVLRLVDRHGVEQSDLVSRLRSLLADSTRQALRLTIVRSLRGGGPLAAQILRQLASVDPDGEIREQAAECVKLLEDRLRSKR